jgi:hypothetical protein
LKKPLKRLQRKLVVLTVSFLLMSVLTPFAVLAHDTVVNRDAKTTKILYERWMHTVEHSLLDNDVLEGHSHAGEHSYDQPVTQAAYLKMLVKVVYSKKELAPLLAAAGTCSFANVKDKEACQYLELAKKLDILSGYPNAIKLQNNITRSEMLFFTLKIIPNQFTSKRIRQTFTDVDKKHWAYDAITRAVQQSLISGFSDGTFKPDQAVKQSEAMIVLNYIMKLIKQAKDKGGINQQTISGIRSIAFGELTLVWDNAMNPQGNVFYPGQTVPLSVQLINSSKGAVELAWSVTGGSISEQMDTHATWTAPMTEGEYTITLTAANKKGIKTSVTDRFVVSDLALEEEFKFADPANFVDSDELDIDSDGDGLLDSEEKALGTNPQNKDTDNDDINDYNEAKVYGTNPLKAD